MRSVSEVACAGVALGAVLVGASGLAWAQGTVLPCERAVPVQVTVPAGSATPAYVAAYALERYDPDGPGPSPEALVVAGDWGTGSIGLASPAGLTLGGVALAPLGQGMDGPVYALARLDVDGAGPAPEVLVAGGEFALADGSPAANIAAWDGAAWQALGAGLDGRVTSLAVVDFDGPGPGGAVLVVGGDFQQAGGVFRPGVAVWNGSAWSALAGWTYAPLGPSQREVTALSAASWDFGSGLTRGVAVAYRDALAPGNVQLFAAGGAVGGALTDPFGSFFALLPWGGAPGGAGLVAGGFATGGQVLTRPLASGGATGALGSFDGSVYALALADFDGAGPRGVELVLGGGFIRAGGAGGVVTPYLARHTGAAVGGVGAALLVERPTLALLTLDTDGAGAAPEVVVAAHAAPALAGAGAALSVYGNVDFPRVQSGLDAVLDIEPGTTVDLFAIVSASPEATFRWLRNGQELIDGPTGTGSTIVGAASGLLRIETAGEADAGAYVLEVSGPCGSNSAFITQLQVAGQSCPGDYNRDGILNLDDLGDFITDFYTEPAIPGGLQVDAPTYPGVLVGFTIGCPQAGDAPLPYLFDAYRQAGFRVAYSPDGSNACPLSPEQTFPNLDNLSDFITAYYGIACE
jgi:hypothetical protein